MNKIKNQYKIEQNKLITANGQIINFDYPIAETLDFPEVIIARLNIPPKANFNENVFGISYEGKILWQILPQQHLDDDSPYTGMNYENGNAGLYNWDATLYIVNPLTGQVITKQFVK